MGSVNRRSFLSALPMLGMTAPAVGGFHVTGELNATEQERQEGYVFLGRELLIATHPKSPIYGELVGMVGKTVKVSVVEV